MLVLMGILVRMAEVVQNGEILAFKMNSLVVYSYFCHFALLLHFYMFMEDCVAFCADEQDDMGTLAIFIGLDCMFIF